MSDLKIIVQKYGGTSVGTRSGSRRSPNALRPTLATVCGVVVVSAMGNPPTARETGGEISANPSRREMDMLLATGEQVSIAPARHGAHEIGMGAISYTGFADPRAYRRQSLERANREHSPPKRSFSSLSENKVVIVAGSRVSTRREHHHPGARRVRYLGVALAAALKTRDARFTPTSTASTRADPRVIQNPRKLNESATTRCSSSPAWGRKCCIRVRSSSPRNTMYDCTCGRALTMKRGLSSCQRKR